MDPENRFFMAYAEAALWSSVSDDEDDAEAITDEHAICDLSDDAETAFRADCAGFLWLASGLIAAADEDPDYHPPGDCRDAFDHAGHDFWLTRNGHGCGFWETPDWPEAIGTALDTIAKAFGETWLYAHDGTVEVM